MQTSLYIKPETIYMKTTINAHVLQQYIDLYRTYHSISTIQCKRLQPHQLLTITSFQLNLQRKAKEKEIIYEKKRKENLPGLSCN